MSANMPLPNRIAVIEGRIAELHDAIAKRLSQSEESADLEHTLLVLLQLRSALALIDADLARLSDVLANVALEHSKTPMAGRTWLQQAVPITFGLKIAGAVSAMERHRARLRRMTVEISLDILHQDR